MFLWIVTVLLVCVVGYQWRQIRRWRRRVQGALRLFETWHKHAEDTEKDTIAWKIHRNYYLSKVFPKDFPESGTFPEPEIKAKQESL